MFLRIYLLIFCTGGCLACFNNILCRDLDTAANAVSSNIDAYCPLYSQTIACYAGAGCSDVTLSTMYLKYYLVCPVTPEEVKTCKTLLESACSQLKTVAENYLPLDTKNYCSSMRNYQQCIEEILPTACVGTKVTAFDVMGEDYGKYEITCENTNFIECQDMMRGASCSTYIKTAAEARGNRDFDSLCSSLKNYLLCSNSTFERCNQSLSKAIFLDGKDSEFNSYCRGYCSNEIILELSMGKNVTSYWTSLGQCSLHPLTPQEAEARECQGLVSANCSSFLDVSTGGSLCRKMTNYLDCVTRTMDGCDSSVKEDTVTGQIRLFYVFQCGPEGAEACPAVTTCMATITQEGRQDSGTPNIIKECGKMGQLLSCLDTEFAKCGRTSPRSYSFSDVSRLYVNSCQKMANETDLLDCESMNVCMSNLGLPSDPVEIAKLYYDPEFWCRLLNMAVTCGLHINRECRASLDTMTPLLVDTEKLCYSDGRTTPGSNEQTTGPVSKGFKTDAGTLSYLTLLMTVLIQIHR